MTIPSQPKWSLSLLATVVVLVLAVAFEVGTESRDVLGKDGDLNFRLPGIVRMIAEFLHKFSLALFRHCHVRSRIVGPVGR